MQLGRKVRLAALYSSTKNLHHEEMHLGSDGTLTYNYYNIGSKRRYYDQTFGIRPDKSLKPFVEEMPNDI